MRAIPIITAVLVALVGFAGPARADDVEDAQAVIESQIQAFLDDDAEAAYSYAAPGIRKIYPDTESFFEMVRKGYEPVYRPDNFAFGRSKTLPEGVIVQEVLISGAEGEDWTALYAMEKQPDGSFKIRGVQMVKYAAPET
jgi:hypothetical protein